MIRRRLREMWPDLTGQRVVGLGYATPLLRPFMDEFRARGGDDAGAAGRAALARRAAQCDGTDRGDRAAAARHVRRPGPAGPCARAHRAASAAAARDLARAQPQRPGDRHRAQPARHLGAHRQHAVRPRPPLHRGPALPPAARQPVHAAGDAQRALHPAGLFAALPDLGGSLGAAWRALVRALCRRRAGRGRQAALCADRACGARSAAARPICRCRRRPRAAARPRASAAAAGTGPARRAGWRGSRGARRPRGRPRQSSTMPCSMAMSRSSHSSTKSWIVQRWMFGVSYQAVSQASVTGIRP